MAKTIIDFERDGFVLSVDLSDCWVDGKNAYRPIMLRFRRMRPPGTEGWVFVQLVFFWILAVTVAVEGEIK